MIEPSTAAVICGDLNMLRCFFRSGIPTVVASSNPDEPTLRSRECRTRRLIASPATDPVSAARDLERLGIAVGGRPVLYFGDDAMLLLVSRQRARLESAFRFLLPDADLIEALVDKAAFAAVGSRLGLPTPRTVASTEVDRPDQVLRALKLPCAIKPCNHIGWRASRAVAAEGGKPRKMLRADSREELFRAFDLMRSHTSDFVIQEYVPGNDGSIYTVHLYVDRAGRPLANFVGRKIRTYPRDSGVSTFIELTRNPKLAELGRDVLQKLGFVGVAKLDFKRDEHTGRYVLLEINPRFNLWHRLGAAAGVNLPLVAYADLTGQPIPPPSRYRTDVRWLAFGDDFRAFVRDYHATGELGVIDWLTSLRGPKVFDVFAWHDPVPFMTTCVRFAKGQYGKLAQRTGWIPA